MSTKFVDKILISISGAAALLVINLVSAFTLLLITEKILDGLGGSFDPRTSRTVNLLEYGANSEGIVIPTSKKLSSADSLEPRRYRVRTDANGFIQPSNIHDNPDVSIVFLGGSTTASIFVSEDKRWPAMVGKILEEDSNLLISTANSGRQGNHSMHSNILLISKVLPLKPDIVVLMHSINDFGILHNEGTYWNKNLRRGIINDHDRSFDVQLFHFFVHIKNEYFLNVYSAARSLLRLDNFGQYANPTENWSKHMPFRPERIKQNFQNSLQTFVHVSRSWGIKPVLMTQASRFQKYQSKDQSKAGNRQSQMLRDKGIEEVEFYALYSQMNQVVRDVARAENVGLIDLDNELPKSPDYLYDMIHLNDSGSVRQAEIVAHALLPLACAVAQKCTGAGRSP